jgi:PST family polysaccharide transporter
MTSYKKKAIYGAVQLFWGNNILKVAEFFGTLFLARNIAPEFFGKVGYLISIEMIFWSFMFINPPLAIIRETEDEIEYAKTALSIMLGLCSMIMVVIIISSYFLPKFDNELRLLLMIMIFTKLPDSVVTSIYAPFLDKEFMYTKKAIVEIIPVLIGLSVACIMVLLGFKIEALVARYGVDHVVRFFLVLFLAPYKFFPTFRLKYAKKFFHFNMYIGVAGFLRDISSNFESFIFANLANMRELGLHNRGFVINNLATESIVTGISSVMPSVVSKKKNDIDFLSKFYEFIIGISFRVVLFFSVLFYFEGKIIIEVLYGSQWVDAVLYLKLATIFAIGSVVFSHTNTIHSIAGNPRTLTITQLYRATSFFVLTGIFAYFYGYIGVVMAYIAASVLSASVSVYYFYLKAPFEIFKTFFVPLIVSLITALSYLFAVKFIPAVDWNLLNLGLRLFVLFVLYISFLLVLDLSTIKKYYSFVRN